jgi:hypothetical protein
MPQSDCLDSHTAPRKPPDNDNVLGRVEGVKGVNFMKK